ncbi:uncharacterized protein LOC144107294 [Amblyomma americanum]
MADPQSTLPDLMWITELGQGPRERPAPGTPAAESAQRTGRHTVAGATYATPWTPENSARCHGTSTPGLGAHPSSARAAWEQASTSPSVSHLPNGTTETAPHATRSPLITAPDSETPANAANLAEVLASALQQALQSAQPSPRIGTPIPKYSGYSDQTSANHFLLALDQYGQTTGTSERDMLRRVIPVALGDQAARWYRLVGHTASTMADFRRMFREEFLPYDYQLRMRRELELRTQAPDESLVEYVRAMQELYDYADPGASNAERVERVVRQSHPTFALYLRGNRCGDLNELAVEARRVQAEISAARAYRPPPPPSESLEPSCAWNGSTRPRSESARAPAHGALFEVSDRALDPYSYGLRATEVTRPGVWSASRQPPDRDSQGRSNDREGITPPDGQRHRVEMPVRNALTDGRAREQPRPSLYHARNSVRCFNCDQAGHIARACPAGPGNEAGRR